jgi:acyl carrier protein
VENNTHQRIVSTLRAVFENKGIMPPGLTPETPLDRSLGLDSLDYAELVVRLEQEFGKDPFSSGTPPQVRTLGDLSSYYE